MEVAKAIKKRRSVRSFKNQPIEPEQLEKILEAARLAPSAFNNQDWRFVVVRNRETLQALARACDDQEFVAEAGAVICCCATKSEHVLSNGEPAYALDLAIAGSFIMLQATELELGSCWTGAYQSERVKRLLRIPEEVRVVGIIALGHSHYVPSATARKPLAEVVADEHFDQPYEAR